MQAELRLLKENWWIKKAEDLQAAADEHDMKQFYSSLKTVLGPQSRSTTPVSHDGSTLFAKHEDVLQHWADHFNLLMLNRPFVVDIDLNLVPFRFLYQGLVIEIVWIFKLRLFHIFDFNCFCC